MNVVSIGVRAFLSAGAYVGFHILNASYQIAKPLIVGSADVQQLNPSDGDYVKSQVIGGLFSGDGLPVMLLFLVMVVIWFGPLKNLYKAATTPTEPV